MRDWDIKGVGAGIFDFDIVLDNPVQLDFVNTVKYADTVGDMNDIISFSRSERLLISSPFFPFDLFAAERIVFAEVISANLTSGYSKPEERFPARTYIFFIGELR